MAIDTVKQRILAKTPLGDLIGTDIKLERRSGRLVGLCPFHEEKSGSFTIFDDHYFCFGCRAHGDAIEFVRKTRGLGFIEALKFLAEKFGVDASELEQNRQSDEERRKTSNLYKVLRLSQDYFKENLAKHSSQIIPYLEGRGFSESAIQAFEFGYAPDSPKGLVNHLLQRGVALDDAISASVASRSQKDRKAYDFYIDRLMIPIRDHHGRLIAFGGRAMGDHPAKYKNSRESPLFDKSTVLYGLDAARTAIREKQRAIVVEGYMDALQLRNFGFTETVACLGTAVTAFHLQRLSQLAKEVIFLFDGDAAGERAGLRAVTYALDIPRTQFKMVRLPEKHDPDSYLRDFGVDALENKIKDSRELLDYAINSKLETSHDLAIPDLIDAELIPWLKSVKDPLKRSFLVGKIAGLSGVDRAAIERSLENRRQVEPEKKAEVGPTRAAAARGDSDLRQSKALTRKLTAVEYDFLGHLFHAQPGDLDLPEIQSYLQLDLELESLWLDLAEEFVKSLKKNQSPKDVDKSYWDSSSELAVIYLLDSFVDKAEAFVCDNRAILLTKLSQIMRIKQLEGTRQNLKVRLSSSNPDEQLQILTAIHKLNSEIKSLGR